MKFPQPILVEELIRIIGQPVVRIGFFDGPLTGLNEFHSVEPGDVTFVDCDKYVNRILQSQATAIITNQKNVECPEGKVILLVDDPLMGYLNVVHSYRAYSPQNSMIHPDAVITALLPRTRIACVGHLLMQFVHPLHKFSNK